MFRTQAGGRCGGREISFPPQADLFQVDNTGAVQRLRGFADRKENNVKRFTGSITGKFNACFYLVLAAGALYFCFQFPNGGAQILAGRLFFFLLAAWGAWMGLTTLNAAFAVYELDGDRITRRFLIGMQTLRWSEIARYTTQKDFSSRLTLI